MYDLSGVAQIAFELVCRLPTKLKEFVQREISRQKGVFQCVSEYVRELIRGDQERQGTCAARS